MITFKSDNIFESSMQTMVNPVNCVGVMGAGLALKFKQLYPLMFAEYRAVCYSHRLIPGHPYLYQSSDYEKKILLFPTKDHWRNPSKIEYVRDGLDWFIKNYQTCGISSIAFPALGCGYGNLQWENVRTLMVQKLETLNIPIEIYQPK